MCWINGGSRLAWVGVGQHRTANAASDLATDWGAGKAATDEHCFTGRYASVRRFVARIRELEGRAVVGQRRTDGLAVLVDQLAVDAQPVGAGAGVAHPEVQELSRWRSSPVG